MFEIVPVSIVELLLDGQNPRLEDEQAGQQEAALKLAEQQGPRLVALAADIVAKGTDPTTLLAIVATDGPRRRYRVLEGNRRVLALKALETPSLVTPALSARDAKRLAKLSAEFLDAPIDTVQAVLFDDEDEALHWVELRHTGANDGSGLVEWGAAEKDRFSTRHAGAQSPAGQVIEFVKAHGNLSAEAMASKRGIITNVQRLLSSPTARRGLGIDISDGRVIALHSEEAVIKSLTRVVEDLLVGRVAVPDLYRASDRETYVKDLPDDVRPTDESRLDQPLSLPDLAAGKATPAKPAPKKRQRTKRPRARNTVIPNGATLNVTPPRLSAIHNELSTISAEQYPNACGVLLRVFLELSVDHFIAEKSLSCAPDAPLAKRLKAVSRYLFKENLVDDQLRKAVEQIADGASIVAPGITTFHQYVHNKYVFPKPQALYDAWDELEPFLKQVWP